MAVAAYWEAIRAGVDGLDVCVSALSMGPSVQAIETFLAALKGTSRDPKIDIGQFRSINDDLKDELMKKALGDEKPEFKRPGDLLEPGIEAARQGCAGLARVWEDVLTYALFPNEATEFLKIKYGV